VSDQHLEVAGEGPEEHSGALTRVLGQERVVACPVSQLAQVRII
jgi:hypothetical protein